MDPSTGQAPGEQREAALLSEEAGLVERARQGDQAAWEALLQRCQQPVYRFAYLLLGDPDEAEDAAQEAFIRFYRSLERYDASRPLLPWLLSITANLARNRRRSLGRFFQHMQRLGREQPELVGGSAHDDEQRWQSQALWQAVRRLEPGDQQVIYLRYFLDLTVEHAAQAMEVAPGTVKSRLHRAVERLRRLVDRDYPDLKDVWT